MTITSITPKQEKAIPEFIDKWIKNASSNNNREAAAESINHIYKEYGLDTPLFIHTESPMEAVLLVAIISKYPKLDIIDPKNKQEVIKKYKSKISKEKIRSVYGNVLHNQWLTASCGWFDYAQFIGVQFDKTQYDLFYNYCQSVFACIPYENVCFVIDKPIEIHFKDKKLHNETGPSILFADGYGLYSLNGVRVPKWLVTTPANKIDPGILLREKNAEIRREIVRKVGIQMVCEKLKTKTINTWGDYELLELKLPGMETKARYLKMRNPSIGTYHIEGVPSDIETCQDALTWRCDGFKWNPSQLT